jgi:hypothetical protein
MRTGNATLSAQLFTLSKKPDAQQISYKDLYSMKIEEAKSVDTLTQNLDRFSSLS